MEEIKINGKAIYTTKGAAREYGRVGCNFYVGCPHECEYCYLKRGAPSKQLGGNVVQLKKCFKNVPEAINVFTEEINNHYEECKKYGIFFSFTTDPLISETRNLTFAATNIAIGVGIPVYILTKDATFMASEAFEHLKKEKKVQRLVHFGFTLTGCDDMEPKASNSQDRIEAMRILHNKGYKTWASIEPVIEWNKARLVIDDALEWCDHYKIGLRSGVKKGYYDIIQSGMRINELTKMITNAGRTVYLKESVRTLLRSCFSEDVYNEILSRTVDMDGKAIKK